MVGTNAAWLFYISIHVLREEDDRFEEEAEWILK